MSEPLNDRSAPWLSTSSSSTKTSPTTRPSLPRATARLWTPTTASPRRWSRAAARSRGGNALKGTDTATSIRGDVVTDGPFVETKEALGGFYLIEADDLDQAIKIAGMVPAQFGGVEVRPVAVFPEG